MKKFIVYTRALAGCRKADDPPTIMEVEGEKILALEDPSVMWMPEGEFYFRITRPESIYEPHEVTKADKSKEKIFVPPVYHSHAIIDTLEQARTVAEDMIRFGFEFQLRKHGTPIDYVKMLERCKEIREIMLP